MVPVEHDAAAHLRRLGPDTAASEGHDTARAADADVAATAVLRRRAERGAGGGDIARGLDRDTARVARAALGVAREDGAGAKHHAGGADDRDVAALSAAAGGG